MNSAWLSVLRRYVLFLAPAHLAWEAVQLPLYTLWREGTVREKIVAAIHCTGGDLLIAVAALVLALLLAGRGWPSDARAFGRVAALTVVFGVLYTIFSEWLNVVIRQTWAYAEIMPIVPVIGTGLSPLLQWIAIPLAAFRFARPR